MGHRTIIWRNKLENFVDDLYFQKRKTFKEIAEIIKKEKKISISCEAVRNYLNSKILQEKTGKNTI
jgi:hypothetical protein